MALSEPALEFLESADRCFMAQDFSGASEALERAISSEPQNSRLLAAHGAVLFQLGRYDQARQRYQAAVELESNNPVLWFQYSVACLKAERFDAFEEGLRKTFIYQPDYPEALKLLAGLNFQQGRWSDAILIYQRLLKQNRADVESLAVLGVCHFKLESFVKAKDYFQRVLDLEPANATARCNLELAKHQIEIRANQPPPVGDPEGIPSFPAVTPNATRHPDQKPRTTFDSSAKNGCQKARLSNGSVFEYRRIYHYHVRKTGGTSINHAFLALGGEGSKAVFKRLNQAFPHATESGGRIYVGWDPPLIEGGKYYYGFSHRPRHEIQLPPETFTLTCLRDPARRILSHYRMLMQFKINRVDHFCMREEGPWLGESIWDFVRNMPREHLFNQIYMFSQDLDVNEAFDHVVNCHHIMFTEQFAAGLSQLSQCLGVALKPVHTRKSEFELQLTSQEMDRLKDLLQPEYELIEKVQVHLKNAFCHSRAQRASCYEYDPTRH